MARGFRIDIEGIEALSTSLGLNAQQMNHAVQKALAGPGGEDLAADMRSRTPVGTGSFGAHTRDDIKVRDEGLRKGVLVGYQGQLSGGNKGGGRLQKGAWLESGTKPHVIHTKRNKGGAGNLQSFTSAKAMRFNGVFTETVHHPGTKAQWIAKKSLKSARSSVESAIVDELNIMAAANGWQGGWQGL